ncbi:hypothetical protein B0J17DRAFT_632813 [Rhizoctonia solani]|nr:hypothetical protein B0J17DRAFT_632813 [Rhizoctonia solani]
MTMLNQRSPRGSSARISHMSTRKQRKKANKIIINQLPPEILSYIMLFGVESDRRVWSWDTSTIGSQWVASQVCRHWRDVAINTPFLWTFVPIRNALLSDYTSLKLTRAGSTALLDIAVDMACPEGYRINTDGGLFSRILYFLITHGAESYRWKALLIRSGVDQSQTLTDLAAFTGQHSVPNLQRLCFDCSKRADETQESRSSQISFGSLSNLRYLELISSPHDHSFLSVQSFTKLTTLAIVSYGLDSARLSNVILSNPQLETLRLKDGNRSLGHRFANISHINRIKAPSLRWLLIQTGSNPSWALCMAITIHAPGLHHFALRCGSIHPDRLQRLMAYITTGVRSPNLTKSDSAGNSIYPSLRSLDICRISCQKDTFQSLISSFLHLTHLTAGIEQVGWMHEAPWMLPKLRYLGAHGLPAKNDAIMGLLSRRGDIGIPINEIWVQGGCLRLRATHHKPLSCQNYIPSVAFAYEYYEHEDVVIEEDLQVLR